MADDDSKKFPSLVKNNGKIMLNSDLQLQAYLLRTSKKRLLDVENICKKEGEAGGFANFHQLTVDESRDLMVDALQNTKLPISATMRKAGPLAIDWYVEKSPSEREVNVGGGVSVCQNVTAVLNLRQPALDAQAFKSALEKEAPQKLNEIRRECKKTKNKVASSSQRPAEGVDACTIVEEVAKEQLPKAFAAFVDNMTLKDIKKGLATCKKNPQKYQHELLEGEAACSILQKKRDELNDPSQGR